MILESLYQELTKYGGVMLVVSKPVIGDKSTGKNPVASGWSNADLPSQTLEACNKRLEMGYNIGCKLTGPNSCLVCIDCDADTPAALYNNDDYSDFFQEDTLVIKRDEVTLRYKAVYAVSDRENLDKLRNIPKDKCVSEYELFLASDSARQIVVAGKHALTGAEIISNEKPIAQKTVEEIRQLFIKVSGSDPLKVDDPKPVIATGEGRPTKEKGNELPDIETLMLPYLKNVKRSPSGWVNGVITDGTGVNAGYNPSLNVFKVWASKGQFAGWSGGPRTFYALMHDINPSDKAALAEQYKKDGYSQPTAQQLEEEKRSVANLRAMEEAVEEAKEAIREIEFDENENALSYVEKTISMRHMGDKYPIRLMLLISMLNKIRKSRGIILFVGGETGSGKSDLAERLYDIIPHGDNNKMALKMNMSPTALWYSTPAPHSHLICDEGAIYDELQTWMKLATSNWDIAEQRNITTTPDRGERTAQIYYTPVRCSIYSFRYEATGDEQIQDRSLQLTLKVTPEKERAVREYQLAYASGAFDESEDEYKRRVEVCQKFYTGVPNDINVVIPFASRIKEDPDFASNRMRKHYLGLIMSAALWRSIGKVELTEGMKIEATTDDYELVIDLFHKLQEEGVFSLGERAGDAIPLRDFIYNHDWQNEKSAICLGLGKYLISVSDLSMLYNNGCKKAIRYQLLGRDGKNNGLVAKSPALELANAETIELPDGVKIRSNAQYIIIDTAKIVTKQEKTSSWGIVE